MRICKLCNLCWFTNLDHKSRNEPLLLTREYKPEDYPKYDNYDAIDVSRTCNIPEDYAGPMGVPISFLDKYNPDQFEILGLLADKRHVSPALLQGTPTYLDEQHKRYVGAILHGNATYARIVIRNRNPKKPE